MGVSGIGYGGFDRYSMNGYASVPNSTQSAGSLQNSAGGSAVSGTMQTGAAGAAGVAGDAGPTLPGTSEGAAANKGGASGTAGIQAMKRTGAIECQTCKNRTYQDGSNDPGVSFKAPGHIDPASSGAAVMSHEQEHVANEQANAAAEGHRVVSQSVRLFTAVCPECGRVYVSGGETRTVTASDNSQQKAASSYKSGGNAAGKLFNMAV